MPLGWTKVTRIGKIITGAENCFLACLAGSVVLAGHAPVQKASQEKDSSVACQLLAQRIGHWHEL